MSKLSTPMSVLALVGMLLGIPGLAHAVTGRVVKITSCPDGANPRKLLVKLDNNKWYYLGTEAAAQTSTVGSIAMAALLSGKPITFDNSTSAANYCNGITAFYANTSFIEIAE